MSDRVPICTIPGVVSAFLNTDIMVAPADVAKLVTRVFLQRTDNGSGDVVTAGLYNSTGGGGDVISVTLADGESEHVSTGSMTVEASEALYLRVTAADENSMNLRGWFQVDGAAGVTTALTNLARVEQWLDADTGDDDFINNLIAGVSGEIQKWLGVNIIETTSTSEKIDSIGDSRIHTHYFPIITISSLTEGDTALTEDTGFECKEWDKIRGAIIRISDGDPISWESGTRVVTVTYSYGYSTVPDVITQVATELVAFDYMQSPASGRARLGLTAQTDVSGGSSTYITRADLWEGIKARLSPYKRAWL